MLHKYQESLILEKILGSKQSRRVINLTKDLDANGDIQDSSLADGALVIWIHGARTFR